MGYQKFKKLILFALCLSVPCCSVHASTASDLYAVYGMEYTPKYSEDILDTIQRYDNAKKYIAMYQYVALSEFDTTKIDTKLEELSKRKAELEEQLLGGFSLELNELYLLEDEYNDVCTQLDNYEKSKVSYEVEYSTPTPDDVPTYSEYVTAIKEKSSIDTLADIGNLDNLKPPFTSASLIESKTNSEIIYRVATGTTVTSLFNGTVVAIDSIGVTVDHHNNIYTLYSGLSDVYVEVGDTVYQGAAIGAANDLVKLKCKVNSKIVDVSKLFKED